MPHTSQALLGGQMAQVSVPATLLAGCVVPSQGVYQQFKMRKRLIIAGGVFMRLKHMQTHFLPTNTKWLIL